MYISLDVVNVWYHVICNKDQGRIVKERKQLLTAKKQYVLLFK
jgi:hypothetical protein